jgi:hypothetical protein
MDIGHVTWRKSSYSASGGGNCVEVGVWRKSSYSGSGGGACIEVGLWRKASFSGSDGGGCVEAGLWTKASYSTSSGGNCVEVTRTPEMVVGVRDSKDPDGPRLAFGTADWAAFTRSVKDGQFTLA